MTVGAFVTDVQLRELAARHSIELEVLVDHLGAWVVYVTSCDGNHEERTTTYTASSRESLDDAMRAALRAFYLTLFPETT